MLNLMKKILKDLKKKAAISMDVIVTGAITVIIGIILVFRIVGNTSGDLTAAATNISSSGLPLAGLFTSNGIVMLLFMAGVLLLILRMAFKMGKK